MSKSTLRKRIALTATTALFAGMLSVASAPVASAHTFVDDTNRAANTGTLNGSLFTATKLTTTGTVVAPGTAASGATNIGDNSTSRGLLAKDTSSGTAQTATVLAGAVLSLYAQVNTATAFTVTGGTLSSVVGGAAGQATAYAQNLQSAITTLATVTATGTGAVWTLPTTPGTYTVNLLTGFTAVGATFVQPSFTVGLPPTLSGAMTVTVVAASAGGTYSATTSACNTAAGTRAFSLGAYPTGVDSTATKANGDAWSIDFSLRDAYNVALSSGALTATATNGALINFGTSGTTPTAGTTSTVVSTSIGVSGSSTVRVDQPTAGAPLTTTVTISFNGSVICTKTVTIRGAVDKLVIANVGTQDLSASAGSAQWMYQEIGLHSAGLFTVLATDSAGNIVATPATLGTFSMDATTTTPTIQGLTFPTLSSSNSSTDTGRFTLGSFTCGAVAGSGSPVVVFTAAATGKITKSSPFTARCADDAVTYSASFDKASYNNGDIATLTVQFLDSKGNKAQNVTAYGASSIVVPMMTAVSSASATSVTKADGTLALTYTVGLAAAAASPGTYAGVVTFTAPALGTTQALKYSIVDQAGTVSNAEVLKSIVALIASINKQIQALQKLILRR